MPLGDPGQHITWKGSQKREAGSGPPEQGPFPCWQMEKGTQREPWLRGSPLNALTVTRVDMGASACVLLILSPRPGSELGSVTEPTLQLGKLRHGAAV